VAQDRDQWRVIVITVMNLRVWLDRKGKRQLERPRLRWKNNIKIDKYIHINI
jgi:hypothetical protein